METDWEKIKSIFAEAVALPVGDRVTYLIKHCDGNDEMLAELRSLLDASDEPDNLIEYNSLDLNSALNAEPKTYTDKHFGNFRIISEIGRGGMGAVFLAERDDGEFTQQVALKIVRQSIADSAIIERFRRERQILATLNHPNIAMLHDGGVNAEGEPFLAMEYVDGRPLTDYVREKNLSINERLRLFIKVCGAVAFAHRSLIIHRDIKPSNILVTDAGEPKLLDFGLAKVFETDNANNETVLRAFTPAYASPEQIQGGPVTTAGDVYSLGVVLYELLSGETPFNFEGKAIGEIIEAVTVTEPPLPSRISRANSRSPAIDSDLDTITLKALRKTPSRRYATVEAFADDIDRYLDGRPISARPNTFAYRTKKFVKRNRLAVAAASVVLIAIFAALAVSLWQARIARRESAKSEAVNKFLQQMLATAIPGSGGSGKRGVQASMIDILDNAAQRLDGDELASQPEVRAELRQVIGQGYIAQGLNDKAQRLIKAAFEEQVSLYGRDSIQTLRTEMNLAEIYLFKADYDPAFEILERRFQTLRDEFLQNRIEPFFFVGMLNGYALAYRARGNSEVAEQMLRESVEICNQRSVVERLEYTTNLLTLILLDQGKFDDAKSSQQAVVSKLRLAPDENADKLSAALTLLGSILMEKGELKEAEADLLEAERDYRKLYGPDYTAIYDNIRLQAQVSYLLGNYATAGRKIEIVLDNYRKTSNPKYISFATAMTIQGLILNKTGKPAEAETILREAYKLRTENLPATHFMTALTQGALGEVLLDAKRIDEASPLIRASYASLLNSQNVGNERTKTARARLARLEEHR